MNVYNGTRADECGECADWIPGFPHTALKWLAAPQVMCYGPRRLYRRYHPPMYITENGQSCNDRIFLDGKVHDPDCIDSLHRYLPELREYCAKGVPIRGYFRWSPTDNFGQNNSYDERMGLVYLHYPIQRRIVGDSAEWYARTAQTNGRLLQQAFSLSPMTSSFLPIPIQIRSVHLGRNNSQAQITFCA